MTAIKSSMAKKKNIIPAERIASQIYLIRGQSVMLDFDLADLYGVKTKRLNEQVTRNLDRFPEDFMFRLSSEELENLRSQIATSSWGGRRTAPRAFTELGVSMLSSVLRSDRAVQINISIMRTFVKLRQMLASNEDLARKIHEHDHHISRLYEELDKLLMPPNPPQKNPIGFKVVKKDKK